MSLSAVFDYFPNNIISHHIALVKRKMESATLGRAALLISWFEVVLSNGQNLTDIAEIVYPAQKSVWHMKGKISGAQTKDRMEGVIIL